MFCKSEIYIQPYYVYAKWTRNKIYTQWNLINLIFIESLMILTTRHSQMWNLYIINTDLLRSISIKKMDFGTIWNMVPTYQLFPSGDVDQSDIGVMYQKQLLEAQGHTLLNKTNLRDLIAATGLVILLKLDLNRRFFSPCDLEIWWMTPKNNRAPLLCYSKLFA